MLNGLIFWVGVIVAVVSLALISRTTALIGVLVALIAKTIGSFGPRFEIVKGAVGYDDRGDATGVREPRRPLPSDLSSAAKAD